MGQVVMTYEKHVWWRICLAICQLMRHGPCQIWFPLTFMQKESQTQFTLWVACIIVFQGNVVIFVLATKAVSGEDSQMALVTVSMEHDCPNLLSWSCLYLDMQSGDQGPGKLAGNSGRSSLIRGPSIWRACVYMAGGEQMQRGQYKPPGEGQEYEN